MRKIILVLVLFIALALTGCGPDPVELAKLDVLRAEARADEAYADARAADAEARADEAEAQAAAQIASAEAHKVEVVALVEQNTNKDMILYAMQKELTDLIRRQQDLALLVVLFVAALATMIVIVRLAAFLYREYTGQPETTQTIINNYYLVRNTRTERVYELDADAWQALLSLPVAHYELLEERTG